MLCGFQSNLRYNSSCDHHFVLLTSINNTLCMYILDWNCFHDNVCSFQSVPFSKYFREIRLGGKWVPYSLQTVSRFFNFHSISRYERELWDEAYGFFPRRLKSVTVCRWHWKSCTSRHLFKDLDRELVLPGFETPASLSVDRCLSKRGDSLIHLCFTIKWICVSLDRNESGGVREPIPYKPGGFSWASSPGEFK